VTGREPSAVLMMVAYCEVAATPGASFPALQKMIEG
jgi:hypothetical protein